MKYKTFYKEIETLRVISLVKMGTILNGKENIFIWGGGLLIYLGRGEIFILEWEEFFFYRKRCFHKSISSFGEPFFFSAIMWLNSEYKCSTCFQPHYFDMFYIDFVGCHSRRVRGWLAGRGLLYQGVVWRWTSKYYKILFRQLHWRGWSSIFIFC